MVRLIWNEANCPENHEAGRLWSLVNTRRVHGPSGTKVRVLAAPKQRWGLVNSCYGDSQGLSKQTEGATRSAGSILITTLGAKPQS